MEEDAARSGSGPHADAARAESDEPPLRVVKIENSSIRYTIKGNLGKGGFGKVYLGESTGATGAPQKVAVKFEPKCNEVAVKLEHKCSDRCQTSPNEWQAYKALCGIKGVPRMHYNGSQGDYHFTIMDLLGRSLRDRKNMLDKISEEWAKTIKNVAIEAITVLRAVHSKGYVHGDIKPSNLLLGSPETPEEKLSLVDFGLATRWVKSDDSVDHVEYDQEPFIFSGTVDYASVHTLLGRTRSRRDDLESLAYTLISLLCGELPWKEHSGDKNRKFLVCKDKMSRSPESLCCNLPQGSQPVREFFEYVIQLEFDEKPDYTGCISLFNGVGGPKRTVPKQPMQVRTGNPATQWISVYNARQPMQQRYHYGVETAKLRHFVGKGKEEKLLISSVASCKNLWALIIDAGTGFSHQIHEHLPSFPNEEWLKKQWDQGFHITAIAGADNGSYLIVMSQGTQYKQQAFHANDIFPLWWIKEKRKDGFYITSMATAKNEWAVVMSSSDGDVDLEQVIELDFAYPFEGIHRRWANGFQITAAAATQDLVAFVFNKAKKPTDEDGQQDTRRKDKRRQQDTYRTSKFPSTYIKKKWDRNIYITSLCFGRTIS